MASFYQILVLAFTLTLVTQVFGAPPSAVAPAPARQCLNDRYRPQIHFSQAKHWINDPNGMVYLDGEYHLFYQYHPYDTVWGPMHWGHAISTDLVHWEEFPIALFPDHLGQIFSGSAVVDYRNSSGLQTGTTPVIVAIFTHAGDTQQQSIAFSNDRGRSFQTYIGNPVLPNPFIPDIRDPKVIELNGEWIMSLAVGDKIDFYRSDSLKIWNKLSEFGASPPEGSHGGVWECPDLLPFKFNGEDVWVLLVSINPGGPNLGSATQYFLGEFDGRTFRKFDIDEILWMDWGPDNYAGVTFSNEPNGRHVMMAWMSNWHYANTVPTVEWRGQMTLPRVMDLKLVDGKLRLVTNPAPELEALRNPQQLYERTQPMTILPGAVYQLSADVPFNSSLLEVDVVFDTTLVVLDDTASLAVCFFNGRSEEVCQGYSYGTNEIYLDRFRSGNIEFNPEFGRRATAKRQTKSKTVSVKVYLDTSAIEIFADAGSTALTGLYYPQEPVQGINVAFNSERAQNRLVLLSATVRGLNSIYDCPA